MTTTQESERRADIEPARPAPPGERPVPVDRAVRVDRATAVDRGAALLGRAVRLLERAAVPALRISLGLVFVWFGVLKVLGRSPVADLIGATVPWVNPHLLVPALGWVEVVLGLALLAGRPRRLALLAAAVHLSGTFLTFVEAPSMVISGSNPLMLTANGEFVLKNLVLICAALILLGRSGPPDRSSQE
jgi:uncharacterized membrane protein YphA (DoxX/SURF4 family)